jgi:CRISPR-associated protein Cas5t
MNRLWLQLKAPFAAFRPLQAGALRVTAPVMTFTAAWGLLLNLAGVETRQDLNQATTGLCPDAPPLRIAIGLPGPDPGRGTLLQQLHAYPVGNTSKEFAPGCHGAKYHIAPVRRELLIDLDLVLGIEGAPELLSRIVRGLRGEGDWGRYGLPFAGDNNLIFDRMDLLSDPPGCRWYTTLDPKGPPVQGATRLHRTIDRTDSSRTETVLVAPFQTLTPIPPEEAWVWTPRAPVV